MQLVDNACEERIYPVGRLDRNTTGLLLFTNDGDLAKKLVHPKHGVRKIYHVTLDKKLAKHHLNAVAEGVALLGGVGGLHYARSLSAIEAKGERGIAAAIGHHGAITGRYVSNIAG